MAIISLTDCKTFLQITDTSKDAIITALIPVVQDDVKNYCNRSFLDSTGAEDWPPMIGFLASQMVSFLMTMSYAAGGEAKQSESIDSYSYTNKSGGEGSQYPVTITKGLDRYRYASTSRGSIVIQDYDRRGWDRGIIPEGVKKWE